MRFSCTFLKRAVGLIMLLAKTLKSLLMLFILNEIVASRMPWHVPSIYMESFHHGPSVVGLPQVLFGIYSHSQWTYQLVACFAIHINELI